MVSKHLVFSKKHAEFHSIILQVVENLWSLGFCFCKRTLVKWSNIYRCWIQIWVQSKDSIITENIMTCQMCETRFSSFGTPPPGYSTVYKSNDYHHLMYSQWTEFSHTDTRTQTKHFGNQDVLKCKFKENFWITSLVWEGDTPHWSPPPHHEHGSTPCPSPCQVVLPQSKYDIINEQIKISKLLTHHLSIGRWEFHAAQVQRVP